MKKEKDQCTPTISLFLSSFVHSPSDPRGRWCACQDEPRSLLIHSTSSVARRKGGHGLPLVCSTSRTRGITRPPLHHPGWPDPTTLSGCTLSVPASSSVARWKGRPPAGVEGAEEGWVVGSPPPRCSIPIKQCRLYVGGDEEERLGTDLNPFGQGEEEGD